MFHRLYNVTRCIRNHDTWFTKGSLEPLKSLRTHSLIQPFPRNCIEFLNLAEEQIDLILDELEVPYEEESMAEKMLMLKGAIGITMEKSYMVYSIM